MFNQAQRYVFLIFTLLHLDAKGFDSILCNVRPLRVGRLQNSDGHLTARETHSTESQGYVVLVLLTAVQAFGTYSVRISLGSPAILDQTSRDFSQSLEANCGIPPRLGLGRFLPAAFIFND